MDQAKKLLPKALALLFFLCALSGCHLFPSSNAIKGQEEMFDTVVNISFYGSKDQGLLDQAFVLCQDYENTFSRTIPQSEISRLNALGSLSVSEDTLSLLQSAVQYSQKTNGAFDVSIGSASALWDFHPGQHVLPSGKDIEQALETIGYESIRLEGNTVILGKKGMQIDLGGIAKGYIADQIALFAEEKHIPGAVISVGGDIRVTGNKEDGSPFLIGIQLPFAQQNKLIGSVSLYSGSVVSSGIYERGFEKDGRYYHHILDPKTAYPAENDVVSVSIIGPSATAGEALSTACCVLGLEDGLTLVESSPDTEAIFVLKSGEIVQTSGMGKEVVFTPAEKEN